MDIALQCKEALPEPDLVYGCINNVEDDLRVFLSIGKISTFSELLKRAVDITDAMQKVETNVWF